MQDLLTKGLPVAAAALLSGCGSHYYGGDGAYSTLVNGLMLPILLDSSTVDGTWSGSAGGAGSYSSPSGWSYDSSWSGEVVCDSSQIEQLGKDLFDSLRMDVFARGFQVDTDSEATYLEPFSAGTSPAIEMEIAHHNARSEGTVTLMAYPKSGDTYSVKISFSESSS